MRGRLVAAAAAAACCAQIVRSLARMYGGCVDAAATSSVSARLGMFSGNSVAPCVNAQSRMRGSSGGTRLRENPSLDASDAVIQITEPCFKCKVPPLTNNERRLAVCSFLLCYNRRCTLDSALLLNDNQTSHSRPVGCDHHCVCRRAAHLLWRQHPFVII